MTSAVTSKDDDSRLLALTGATVETRVLHALTSCAVDFACIVATTTTTPEEDAERTPNTTSLTDEVFSLLLDLQHLSDKVTSSTTT